MINIHLALPQISLWLDGHEITILPSAPAGDEIRELSLRLKRSMALYLLLKSAQASSCLCELDLLHSMPRKMSESK